MSTRPTNFHINDSHYSLVVRRPVAILMVTLAVGVFGFVSYQRLALTLMPDMSYPALTVRTTFPGTAPEEIENIISRPLEQQLGIIPKLVSISSVSKASQSDVILEFQWKTDMDLVAQEVREKIDRIRFPEGSQRPLLLHFDPSLDPILRLGLSGPQSLYELRHLAEYSVKRKLETLPGVAAIQIKGGLEEQFLVALDESKLSSLKLDISQISSRLQQGNVNMSGGNLREGQTEYLIRTLNEFRTIEEIGTLIVARQNGIDIRLRDIGTVSRYHEDRTVITRVNGQESVEIEVYKEADANVLVVAAAVKEAIYGTAEQQAYAAAQHTAPPPEKPSKAAKAQGNQNNKKRSGMSPADIALAQQVAARTSAQNLVNHRRQTDFLAYQLPPNTALQLLSDQSVFIRNSIDEVQSNAIFGGIIAIVVLFLFLRNLTQTLIVSLCIPISILATFAPMHMWGVSLNIISLGGLALGVGNLVDNAIVVLESIYRCREEGDDPITSVVRGTSEVAMPVVASTLTTVAVFFPIVFVEGVAGQVFGDMALTVVFSQIASLIAALYLIPMLAGKAAGATVAIASGNGPIVPAKVTQGSGVLQFPARGERNRFAHVLRLLGIVFFRLLTGVVLLLAVTLKGLAILIGFALAPLWLIADLVKREPRLWSAFARWAETDQLGPIHSVRIWPGLLCFSAVTRFGRGMSGTARWFVTRRWRGVALIVVPAVIVTFLLITRSQGWWNAAPTAPAVPPFPGTGYGPAGMPGLPVTHWYDGLLRWFRVQPWWVIVPVLVPGLIPLLFVIARFVVDVALRLVGTTVQTTGLALVQLLIGAFKAIGLLLAPPTTVALNAFERTNNALQRKYPEVLAATLRNRFAVLGSAVAALAIAVVFVLPRLGSDLIPQVHQGEFNIDITMPIGTPIERTGEVAERVDRMVREQDEVARTAITVGAEEGASTSTDAGEHTARITVRMRADSDADAETDLIDRIRAEFRNVPEVKLEVSYPALFSFKSPIEIEIRGHDLTTLKRLSREAEAVLASSVPGLVDIRSSLQTGHPEIQVVYNRDRLAEYGLNLRSVADLVRTKVQGRPATQFRQEDQMVDIVVRLREEDRFGLEELRRLVVNPNGNIPITLSAIADLTVNEGPSQIRRVDQQRTALITANTRGADLATVSADIVTAMETIAYPAGFSYNLAGQNKEMKTSLNSLLLAFGLAVFLVYIVMASQFESLVQPLIIMMTVPLAMIGVIVVLWLASIPVTIMVFLGLIILVGIVVNNAIVLIDYINTMRQRGLEKTAAIVEAGRARLRPIMMTAMTTIVGLIPMALGLGEGAEIRAPMAITVIVGLSTATVLTLIVIPTLYYQFTSNRVPSVPGATESQRQNQTEPVALGK